jgi:hypothetical protein
MICGCIEEKPLTNTSYDPNQVSLSDKTENTTEIKNDFLLTHLLEYFPDGKFLLLPETLNVDLHKISFAVHYISETPKIFDVAVGFEYSEDVFHRYLLIREFKFINEDDTILLDFSKGYEGIYGFNLLFSYPNAIGYTPGLVIDTYFDGGDRLADGFTIMWDENKKVFEDVDF